MDTTLVIPTYDRTKLLAQSLGYLVGQHFHSPIVIADSSPSPVCESNESLVASVEDKLDIRYLRYDPHVTLTSKLAGALEKVDSKYSVVCADDDFVLPQAIGES